ncbi:MAG: thiol-disulfide oxidoreductase DCC family protein [Ilumatobacteraceae bacterium]
MTKPAPTLVYDGDCAFCTRCVEWMRRRIRRLPIVVPWQRADLESLALSPAQCEVALQFVDRAGRISSGERAVARVLIHAGRGWKFFGFLILVPGIRHLAGLVYRWVARNRHRLPGGTASCGISTAGSASEMENPTDRG